MADAPGRGAGHRGAGIAAAASAGTEGGAGTVNGISEPVPGPQGGPFRRLEWDVAAGYAMAYMADGTTAGMPVSRPAGGEDAGIARMACSFADHAVTLTTPGGESATIEIEPPGAAPQRAGRRVVYLDQGHWNTLTRRIWEPGSVTRQDGVAADKIIGWARDRRIILPLSSGHVIETTPLYGDKRRRQALAMLDLSRGWYMRNPVHVRYGEIADVLSNASAGAARPRRAGSLHARPGQHLRDDRHRAARAASPRTT